MRICLVRSRASSAVFSVAASERAAAAPTSVVSGLLFAAGTITVERESRLFGAVVAAGGINAGPAMEVWYNADFGRGFFRGLPVVYRAPSTWQAQY